jgi:catechol 2,3-dioxygenase-like lactoylglutathione lyase family enzyme
MKLAWINLFVSDVEGVADWYCETLGLKAQYASPRFTMISGGRGGADVSFHHGKPQKDPGRIQLHFQVADVDAVYKTLKKKGVKFSSPPKTMSWGWRHVYTKDPAGHTIEIVQQV